MQILFLMVPSESDCGVWCLVPDCQAPSFNLVTLQMVLTIKGGPLEEAAPSLSTLYLHHKYPGLKEHSAGLVTEKSQVFGPTSLLYVGQREFAVTHAHDTRVQVLGTDDLTTNLVLIVRHTASGAVGLAQFDAVCDEGLASFVQRLNTLSYGYEGRLEAHLLGAFSDTKGLGAALISRTLAALHKQRTHLELVTCCVGELCTVRRNNQPYPVLYGAGVNVKTGEIFPAQFTDKGPDMDLRLARILTGKRESAAMLDIYACEREELRIGPFTYEPMRAVDIWLQQADEFILQNLHLCPEAAQPSYIPLLRGALKRIKADPYPSVSIFGSNSPRVYRMDEITGQWVRCGKEEGWGGAGVASSVAQQHSFKQEPIPSWPVPPIPVQSQIYY